MLCDLLQNDDKRVDQVLEVTRSLLDLNEVVVEGCCHDRWITVTESSLHMSVKLINLLDIIEANKDHHSLFPNHLLLVLHECEHNILNSCNDTRVAQLGDNVESGHHLEMVL